MDRKVIQIVEDERIVAEDMREILEIAGYEVCGIANCGDQAIELAERHRPDLVLMDIVIRGELDGIETARHIRDTVGTPVVFLTAYSQTGVLERTQELEPRGFLVKPYEESALIGAVAAALSLDESSKPLPELARRETWE